MLDKHPDQITDDDLKAWVEHLVRDEVEEGPRLDYKAIQELERPTDRREVARDASSFANEVGGIILYGVPEKKTANQVPIPSSPYGVDPIPNFKSRVEDIIVDSIQPTLPEFRLRELTGDRSGKVVYMLWVAESWIGVHTVESTNDHRYYRRGQYRAIPMTQYEVQQRYERVQLANSHVSSFLDSTELNYVAAHLPATYISQYVVVPTYPLSIDFGSARMQAWADRNPYPPFQLRAAQQGARTRIQMNQKADGFSPYLEIYRNGSQSVWRPAAIYKHESQRMALAYVGELWACPAFPDT